MKTEKDAREKWCPFARVIGLSREMDQLSPPSNRIAEHSGFTVTAGSLCLASQCMAWDWLAPKRGKELERISTDDLKKIPEGDGWHYARNPSFTKPSHWVRYEMIKVGDCGLKSQPGFCGYDQ